MKKPILFFLTLLFHCNFAQDYPQDFRSPLDISRLLAGSFAELRGFHFHSGIDIKTQQREGKNIYAIADGYVSRIGISPRGYGYALYVTHPNGYTSVYGHLREFNKEIEAYALKQQHDRESFSINVFPPKGALPVKKGEVIAKSGNSGSSGGPHLHFEIRDTKTEETINPFLFGLTTPDTKKPLLNGMYIYALNGNVAGKQRYDLTGTTHFKSPVYASGKVAIGVKAYDKMNGSNNLNGIYEIQLYTNDKLTFDYKVDRFAFSETRYIDCLTDYPQYMSNKTWIYQLYRMPGNQLRMIKKSENDGIIDLQEGKTYRIKIVLKDFAGNTTSGSFKIIGKKLENPKEFIPQKDNYLRWDKENYWANDDVELSFPKGAFYKDFNLTYKKQNGKYYIENDKVPLHKFYHLAIYPKDIATTQLDKSVIAVEYNYGGKRVKDFFPTKYKNGKLIAEVRDFGVFSVEVDTTAPYVAPINIKNGSSFYKAKDLIKFRVKDKQSGINKYDAYIDGQWVVPVYDKKNNLIYINLKKEQLTTGAHNFELKVRDGSNNLSTYKTRIYLK